MATRIILASMCILSAIGYVSCSHGGHGDSGFVGGFGGGFGHGHGHGHDEKDYYAKPQYKYSYGVSDAKTGDNKQAYETRDGHNVEGAYSLQEPDGSWRTVKYYDHGHGLVASVHRSGGAHQNGGGWGNNGGFQG